MLLASLPNPVLTTHQAKLLGALPDEQPELQPDLARLAPPAGTCGGAAAGERRGYDPMDDDADGDAYARGKRTAAAASAAAAAGRAMGSSSGSRRSGADAGVKREHEVAAAADWGCAEPEDEQLRKRPRVRGAGTAYPGWQMPPPRASAREAPSQLPRIKHEEPPAASSRHGWRAGADDGYGGGRGAASARSSGGAGLGGVVVPGLSGRRAAQADAAELTTADLALIHKLLCALPDVPELQLIGGRAASPAPRPAVVVGGWQQQQQQQQRGAGSDSDEDDPQHWPQHLSRPRRQGSSGLCTPTPTAAGAPPQPSPGGPATGGAEDAQVAAAVALLQRTLQEVQQASRQPAQPS
jgi:hypothetical protein